MTQPGTPQPELSGAAESEWRRCVEGIMRGMMHALNNRASALMAIRELAKEPDSPSEIPTILESELQRMRELTAVARSIAAPRGGEEAFDPTDAAAEAHAILQLHPADAQRVTVFSSRDSAPVRTYRWMFVRAMVALALSGAREAPAAGGSEAKRRQQGAQPEGRISIAGEGDWLTIRRAGDAQDTRSCYVAEMARAMGGEPLQDGSGFRLPTLAALRRREAE